MYLIQHVDDAAQTGDAPHRTGEMSYCEIVYPNGSIFAEVFVSVGFEIDVLFLVPTMNPGRPR